MLDLCQMGQQYDNNLPSVVTTRNEIHLIEKVVTNSDRIYHVSLLLFECTTKHQDESGLKSLSRPRLRPLC